MKLRLTGLFSAALLASFLLFGISNQYLLTADHDVSRMSQSTGDFRECLGLCNSRISHVEVATNNRTPDIYKEPDELLTDLESVQYLGFTNIAPLVNAAFLSRHLKWRPPDLYKLNVLFRI